MTTLGSVVEEVYKRALFALGSLDVDWQIRVTEEYRAPTITLRVYSGEPRRDQTASWTWGAVFEDDEAMRRTVEHGVRAVRERCTA